MYLSALPGRSSQAISDVSGPPIDKLKRSPRVVTLHGAARASLVSAVPDPISSHRYRARRHHWQAFSAFSTCRGPDAFGFCFYSRFAGYFTNDRLHVAPRRLLPPLSLPLPSYLPLSSSSSTSLPTTAPIRVKTCTSQSPPVTRTAIRHSPIRHSPIRQLLLLVAESSDFVPGPSARRGRWSASRPFQPALRLSCHPNFIHGSSTSVIFKQAQHIMSTPRHTQ